MEFEFNDEEMLACQTAFNEMDPEERLYQTHYELAVNSEIPSPSWKRFLLDTRVSDWINQELTIIKGAQYRKMIRNAGENDRSYGAAQMLNALGKTFDGDKSKEGNVFIYSAVPLNSRELNAPNAIELPTDIFERRE